MQQSYCKHAMTDLNHTTLIKEDCALNYINMCAMNYINTNLGLCHGFGKKYVCIVFSHTLKIVAKTEHIEESVST